MEKIKQLKKNILENNFFRPRWYSIFINPYFIDRHSLYREMKRFSALAGKDAKILDIGCGIKPYRHLFPANEYIGIDIQGGGHTDEAKTVDAFYNGLHIPFPDDSFDGRYLHPGARACDRSRTIDARNIESVEGKQRDIHIYAVHVSRTREAI